MKTQEDRMVRIVALENLSAMCEHISSTCHRYWIEKVTRSRVWIGYSNPNEYGTEYPIFCVFPCFPSSWHLDKDNPRVLLDILRIVNDSWHGEGWQAFDPVLTECPTLWRDNEEWQTHKEIRESGKEVNTSSPDTCTFCDLPKESN
jgi:hypothetical protein